MFSSYAEDNLTAQKQNVLYIQTLIEIEEDIAEMFEKYILTEFKTPSLSDLSTDSYLGSNFSDTNKMGSNIAIKDKDNLEIKYAITKDGYRKKNGVVDTQNYIYQLYNRDLYRNLTSVSDDTTDISNSYVKIKLQSNEAKTIFELLKNGDTVKPECTVDLKETYCNNKNNTKTIRWYSISSTASSPKWIEYDKENFNKGNISTSMTLSELLAEDKISDLAVGSYVFILNERYVKLVDDNSVSPAKVEILKVD